MPAETIDYHIRSKLWIEDAEGNVVFGLGRYRILDAIDDELVVIETSNALRIVLDRQLAVDRAETILRRYGVPADRSADLKPPRRR